MQAPCYCVTETSYRRAWFEVAIKTIVNMAESLADVTDCLSITPYQFEPTDMSSNGDSEDSESDFDDDQASFTDRLGHTLWCSCAKCTPMPRAVECFCCKELETSCERLEGSESTCITEVEQFKVVCLEKDVLYTALVTMHTVRGDAFEVPITNRLAKLSV